MSNYTVTTNFGAKDGLPSGNPAKLILGAQLTTEFTNIAAAIISKLDASSSLVSSFTSNTGLSANVAATGAVTVTNTGVISLAGTANQITASASSGAVTLSLPQNVIIPAPAGGTALAITGVSTGIGLSLLSQGSTGVPLVADTGTATNLQNIILQASLSTGGKYGIGLDGAVNLAFSRLDVAHTAMTISLNGNVVLNAPTSGSTLTALGATNAFALTLQGSGTASQSFGLTMNAGTNASDLSFRILDTTGSSNYFRVFGDGGTVLSAATGGNQGLGTLNATGLFINGVAVSTGGAAAAGTLTGGTLNATVVNSSLTSVGTLANLTVTNPIVNSAVASTGSFTGTLTGGTTSPTTTCQYTKIGNSVTLRLGAQTFVSNAGTFTVTGIPAAIQPATAKFTTATLATDSTTPLKSALGQVSGGTLTLYLASAVGVYSSSGWTGSGTKGFGDLTLVWDLN